MTALSRRKPASTEALRNNIGAQDSNKEILYNTFLLVREKGKCLNFS
jgi:hypothetical protein